MHAHIYMAHKSSKCPSYHDTIGTCHAHTQADLVSDADEVEPACSVLVAVLGCRPHAVALSVLAVALPYRGQGKGRLGRKRGEGGRVTGRERGKKGREEVEWQGGREGAWERGDPL